MQGLKGRMGGRICRREGRTDGSEVAASRIESKPRTWQRKDRVTSTGEELRSMKSSGGLVKKGAAAD